LIAWEATRKDIDVLTTGYHDASGLTIYHVSGHRDGPGSTNCPGDNLYDLLPTIRTDVSQYPCYNGSSSNGPENDLCENAIELISSETEEFTAATLQDANYEYILQKPSCDDFATSSMKDVFFTFKAIESTHRILVSPQGDVDAVVSVYEGQNCQELTEIACVDEGGGAGEEEMLELNDLTPGVYYTIRVYDYGNELPDNPNFDIAVTHGTLSVANYHKRKFLVFPNPAKNVLNVKSVEKAISQIKILNLNGGLIYTAKPGKTDVGIDVSNLPAGIYFISVQDTEEKSETYKFIKN
jgi:hypothetical protein